MTKNEVIDIVVEDWVDIHGDYGYAEIIPGYGIYRTNKDDLLGPYAVDIAKVGGAYFAVKYDYLGMPAIAVKF